MEELRYYTPVIEEFHEGFRCETAWGTGSPTWEKQVVDADVDAGSTSILYDDWEHEQTMSPLSYRVKHLNQQDIEELGWEFSLIDSDVYDHYYLYRGSETYLLKHSVEGGTVRIVHKTGVESSDVLFFGRAKNYNELKQVMKMLRL